MLSIIKDVVVSMDGTLILKGLPQFAGLKVEVIINDKQTPQLSKNISLKGSVLKYDRPFESVAEDDWEVKSLLIQRICLVLFIKILQTSLLSPLLEF